MTRNFNRVPKEQWFEWSIKAREVFNRVYGFVVNNQALMVHPGTRIEKPYHWKTLAWNAAWIAADAVDDTVATEIVSTDGARTKVA